MKKIINFGNKKLTKIFQMGIAALLVLVSYFLLANKFLFMTTFSSTIAEYKSSGGWCYKKNCTYFRKIHSNGVITEKDGDKPEKIVWWNPWLAQKIKESITVENIEKIRKSKSISCPSASDGNNLSYLFNLGNKMAEFSECENNLMKPEINFDQLNEENWLLYFMSKL